MKTISVAPNLILIVWFMCYKDTILFGKKILNYRILSTILFFCVFVSWSQNGTYILDYTTLPNGANVGEAGTNRSGITPFTIDKKNMRSQYVYRAHEIENLGGPIGVGGIITSIAFNVVGVLPAAGIQPENFIIKIGHTPDNVLSGRYNMPANDLEVYKTVHALNITQNGWYELELDQGFVWDGSANIIVEICKSNDEFASPNFRVKASQINLPSAIHLSRSLYTNNNNNPQTPGCDMYANGAINLTSDNTTAQSDVNRRQRPDIKLQFACNGLPESGVTIIKLNHDGFYCEDDRVTLAIENGDMSSRLTYQWQVTNDEGNSNSWTDVPGATGEELVVERTEENLFYRRVTTCASIGGSNAVPVEVEGYNTYTGEGIWTRGTNDFTSQTLLIDSNFNSDDFAGIFDACSLIVNTGVTFTVNENDVIKLKDKLVVRPGGNLIFENGASLLQENPDAENIGDIRYHRNTTSVRLLDYTYWSSPVEGLTPTAFSPGTPTNKIYHWNHITQAWAGGTHNQPMIQGKGYIIRAPNGFPVSGPGQVFEGLFVGKPNNGNISVPVTTKNPDSESTVVFWNLIGNPYPSTLDADKFLIENQDKIDGTLYFWTHNSSPSNAYTGNHTYNYNVGDFATYNFTGSVGTPPTPPEDIDPGYVLNTSEPCKYIASGQGFMVGGGDVPGSVLFTNDMRVGENNDLFFRTAPPTAVNEIEKHRLWLEVVHEEGTFKQFLLGFVNGATDDLDWGYDGKMLEGGETLIYTVVGEQQLTIDGRSLPFTTDKTVPLVFSSTKNGEFTIGMYNWDGLFESQEVFLEDSYTGVIHNIKNDPYVFESVAGVYEDRFILRFTNETLNVSGFEAETNNVIGFVNEGQLNLQSFHENILSVQLFDLQGRMYKEWLHLNDNRVALPLLESSSQLLVAKIILHNNSKHTIKLLINKN